MLVQMGNESLKNTNARNYGELPDEATLFEIYE